ncbi:ABC transporter substrate-binding protein [Bacteroidales bacterium OttesenSCG-928-I21]|nr:ABC transporter substrate-binding protein [Bacteroidales bacterium OttesenSCG-928-I21]
MQACTSVDTKHTSGEVIANKYSTGFEIIKNTEGFTLNVKNRFSESQNSINTYNLYSEKSKIAGIKIPIKKAVCLSTTHCAFISVLDKLETIKGISGANSIYNEKIIELILENKIIDVGYDKQLNYEKIISLNPDVIFAFGVDNNSISAYQKLNDIGIPIIYINDFLESKPLGRTEWIKFFACFYDKLDNAVEYFDSIETNYNALLTEKKYNNELAKPQILVGLPWKGTWWIPGGNSFLANYISDAGGEYIYKNNTKTESVPCTIEEIFLTAKNADIWLHPNAFVEKKQILQLDERLKNFLPYNNCRIFNNNKRISKTGGNDYWESGVVNPDIILKDLQLIFYPNNNITDSLHYYSELN